MRCDTTTVPPTGTVYAVMGWNIHAAIAHSFITGAVCLATEAVSPLSMHVFAGLEGRYTQHLSTEYNRHREFTEHGSRGRWRPAPKQRPGAAPFVATAPMAWLRLAHASADRDAGLVGQVEEGKPFFL
jgi:hypothetical protein